MFKRTLLLALALGAGLPLLPQGLKPPVFHVDVEMVLLNVAVTDSKGNYVTGLQPRDFQILEDGIPQTMATFAEGNQIPRKLIEVADPQSQPQIVKPSDGRQKTRETTPKESNPAFVAGASVFILFDTSNSMYRGFVYAQDAISDFIRFLDPPDRVAFYSFSRDMKRVATLSHDRTEALRAVRKTVAGDEIALYNALLLTLKDAAQLSGRKMIVVFSNGPDSASVVPPESVRDLAQAEGIPIYMVSTQDAKQDPVSTAAFERMSSSTGGKAYFAKSWKEQEKAFTYIREDLSHLYLLSYYPEPNPNSGWRRINVRLVGAQLKNFKIRTRIGYRPKQSQIQ